MADLDVHLIDVSASMMVYYSDVVYWIGRKVNPVSMVGAMGHKISRIYRVSEIDTFYNDVNTMNILHMGTGFAPFQNAMDWMANRSLREVDHLTIYTDYDQAIFDQLITMNPFFKVKLIFVDLTSKSRFVDNAAVKASEWLTVAAFTDLKLD